MKPALRVFALALLVALLIPALLAACPLCKDAMPDKPGQSDVWRGMYWSILLMVAAPFTMVGAMIVALRRARRRVGAALPPSPAPLSFPSRGGAGS